MTLSGSPYPGNPAIPPEVRERILTTFAQTLQLAEAGQRREAALGCDFVLQLDPAYRPARRLLDRLGGGEGPVSVADLEAGAEADGGDAAGGDLDAGPVGGGPSAGGEPDDLPDIEPLDDLPDLEDGGQAAGGADLPGELAALVAARRFEAAVELAGRHQAEVVADAELAALAQAAAAGQEASHYADGFLASARRARERGDEAEALALEEKARALDPANPGLAGPPAAPAVPEAAPAAAVEASFADLDFGGLGESPGTGRAAAASGPGAAAPAEEEQRIRALLDEGQAAYDRGDHQSAIDSWSRIFLIDIDHREAARRIEEARRLKAEQERRAEEVFHDAERAIEAGDREAARRDLERVLNMLPGHLAARQQLERLDDPEAAASAPAPPLEPPAPAHEPLRQEILVPPEPGVTTSPPAAAAPTRTVAAARGGRPALRFALIGSGVLVAVLALSYLLWANRASIFPNSDDEAAAVVEDGDPIARATRLHESGRTPIAINQLRRLPPSSPQYQEAQALISQWEAAEASAQPAEATAPDVDQTRRAALLAEARAASEQGDFLLAADRLLEADEMAALGAEEEILRAQVERELAPVAPLIELVRQGEFERALPDLWRRWEADGGDPVAGRLIVDSYYSMAVRELQRGDAASAVDYLDEALTVASDDPALLRHRRFAAAYAERDKDLLYRIYVKHLPQR
jgi:tetratricopeptide (TPR) repeat protein